MQIQSTVGPTIASDQATPWVRGGRDGATVVTELHGKYYEQASRGKAFFGTSASAGIAIILPATGGGHPTLFNPLGSNVNVNIIALELSYVSGNNAPGAIEWAQTANAGSAAATGSPIATFTQVASTPCLIGSTAKAQALWSPTTNTFTSAPTFVRPTGLSLFTGVAATAVAPFTLRAYYDGDLGLAPGTALSLCCQTTTTTALFQVSIAWEEVAP